LTISFSKAHQHFGRELVHFTIFVNIFTGKWQKYKVLENNRSIAFRESHISPIF
jgi:hypothetical protein